MNNDETNQYNRDDIFSKSVRAGKRTYFFDAKATRSNDYYLTITESIRKFDSEEDKYFYKKHKIFLYKEDFRKFNEGLNEAIEKIKELKKEQGEEIVERYSESSEQVDSEKESTSHKNNFTDLDFNDLEGESNSSEEK